MTPEEKTEMNLGIGGSAFERRKKEPSSDTEEFKKGGDRGRHQELERKLRENKSSSLPVLEEKILSITKNEKLNGILCS